jgi:ParB-like chromosome segregation protein Spo0J
MEMNIRHILTKYRDHDDLGWAAMFAYLRTYDHRKIADLTASIAREGFTTPICLGLDGVVLDGNHRLAVAESLDWREIPVEYEAREDYLDRMSA